MAKSVNQKLKLMYLMEHFSTKTDENHATTMADILVSLANKDIKAERKSIYDDIEVLRIYGMDIEGKKEKGTYYYKLVNRDFELAELKLLVDAVQASKFITAKKSNELIKKIEGFASEHDAKVLQRHVYVASRTKTTNELIYYNVDTLHTALNNNSQIRFRYFEWTVQKERNLRKNGDLYEVSPWALSWDDENYYMIAYDNEAEKIKHYRVDKMLNIELTNSKRLGEDLFKEFDMAKYAKKMFGMYGGVETNVKLECENNLVGVIIDRFGLDTIIVPKGENHFTVNINVEVSIQFLAWVIGLGSGAKIVEPESVVEKMQTEVKRLVNQYL